jgi:Skp family chaperone for outer membrane proteins
MDLSLCCTMLRVFFTAMNSVNYAQLTSAKQRLDSEYETILSALRTREYELETERKALDARQRELSEKDAELVEMDKHMQERQALFQEQEKKVVLWLSSQGGSCIIVVFFMQLFQPK